MRGRLPAPSGRAVVVGFVVVAVLANALHLSGVPGVLLVVGALPIVAVFVSFRVNGIDDRMPWLLVVVGMSLLTAVNAKWFIVREITGGGTLVDDALTQLLQMGGYVAVLAASVVVVLRHAPQDGGRAIDGALVGTGLAAPIWEFGLRPQLLGAGTPASGQTLMLVQTLVLLGTAGSLLRISQTATAARASLGFFFCSLSSTVLGLILSVALTDPMTSRQSPWVTVCWLVGYLSLAAAAVHPSAANLTRPGGWRRDELSVVRLTQLGAVLLVSPVVGGVPQLAGQPPDGLLLSVAPLLSIPLVLVRVGQLLHQRAHDQRLLAHQASHDELTGLANRRELFRLAGAATDRLRGGELRQLAVLYGDLDGFKPINDQLGHDAGDHVLRVVSQRLTGCLRTGDSIGRLGGDEFLAVCPDAGPGEAAALRRRIEDALTVPIAWREEDLRVGMTIGIAVGGSRSDVTADALVADADADMYVRKRRRRPAEARTEAVPDAAVGGGR